MKELIFILSLILFLACNKSGQQIPCSSDFGTTNSTGKRISKIIDIVTGPNDRVRNFTYSAEGKLKEIENSWGPDLLVFEYTDDLVLKINYYDDTTALTFYRDSFAYDLQNRLVTRYRYESDSIENNNLNYIENYEYNTDDELVRKTRIDSDPGYKYNRFENYRWEGGNLVHKECHLFIGGLQYEYFYEFDNGINYKLQLPHLEGQAVDLSTNNLVSFTYNDYAGNLDLFCGICCKSYTYNQDGYPVQVVALNDRIIEIEYE